MPPVPKKLIHDLAIAFTRFFSRFMPDRSPVTLVGPGSAEDLCSAMAQGGARRVLVVTDKGLVGLGLVGRMTAVLQSHGVECFVYDGVEPDPTFTHVDEGLAMLRRQRCDAILVIGGGSPMDAAKIVAARATNDKPLARLEGLLKLRRPTLPLFAIPTTAGTGSEATIVAVVSDPATHAKKFFIDPRLVPTMAALDPSLMTGLPPHITAATGMDALTHAVESFLAPTSTRQTESYARTAVLLIFRNLATAYRDGSDLAARKAMALASYYAGLAFTRTGIGYVHAIAHNLGARYGTPHGHANAVVLPRVLEFSEEAARARLALLADMIDAGGGSQAEKAAGFIAAVRTLMAEVGIAPTLPAIQRADIPDLATKALAEAWANYPVPRYMEQDECERLIARLVA